MKRIVSFAVMMLGLTIACPVAAESPSAEKSPYGNALVALVTIPVNRQVAATEIAAICQRSADAIPTLSPRENDWLDSELESPRTIAAIRSLEFSKRWAGTTARNCLRYAEQLIKIQDVQTEAARKSEALFWALLANEILEPDFFWHIDSLTRKNAIELSEKDVEVVENTASLGGLIVKNILIPHLLIEAR